MALLHDSASQENDDREYRRWSQEERNQLVQKVQTMMEDYNFLRWKRIAASFPGRSPRQCMRQYAKLRDSGFRFDGAEPVRCEAAELLKCLD